MDANSISLPRVIETLLLILEGISILAIIFLVYAAFLFHQRLRRGGRPTKFLLRLVSGFAFVTVAAVAQYAAHNAAAQGQIDLTANILAGGIVACALVYFGAARSHWDDDHVQYTVLMWAIFSIIVYMLMEFVYWLYAHGGAIEAKMIDAQSLSQYINTIAQVAGILMAATMVVITNRHNARQADETARQQIYQTLEIESVKLFRFEINNRDLVERLWCQESACANDVDDYILREYICQILNLFEMACRFRRRGIIDADVFGSWIIWMWELCGNKTFREKWRGEDNIEFNYIKEFRELINAGIYFHTEEPLWASRVEGEAKDRRNAFFRYVDKNMVGERDDPYAKYDLAKWFEKTYDPNNFSWCWYQDK